MSAMTALLIFTFANFALSFGLGYWLTRRNSTRIKNTRLQRALDLAVKRQREREQHSRSIQ